MKLTKFESNQKKEVIPLFEKSFGDSEGEAEGKVIGSLVLELLDTTEKHDLFGYCAMDRENIVGCIFFSRLSTASDRSVFMLSPVAVATNHQRTGVGQSLINYGLEKIKSQGVDLVVTYGDPNYYSKVGFNSITEKTIAAPYSLSYPEGWQAQSLTKEPISPVQGKTQCVEAFRNQEYW